MILVTGGAGVIGSRLVKGLADAGHRVRVLTLPGDPYVSRLDGLDVEIAYGDVSDASTLEGVFDGVDTVFHLAAILLNDNPEIFARVNAGGTRNLVEASTKAGVQHFIFCSSISVTYPYTTPYNASKREGERIVKEQGAMKWTIVRPTLAYNENGGEEYAMFVDFLKKYPVGIFVGRGRALKNPVHVDDLMKGFLAIPGNPNAPFKWAYPPICMIPLRACFARRFPVSPATDLLAASTPFSAKLNFIRTFSKSWATSSVPCLLGS